MLNPISFLRYQSSYTTYLSILLVNPSHGFTKSSSSKTTPAIKTSTANRCYIDFHKQFHISENCGPRKGENSEQGDSQMR